MRASSTTASASEQNPNRRRNLMATKNAQMICPHCQTRGHVSTERTKMKQGISGGKATGAVLTMGVSMLATGLSRKQKVTKANCKNCASEWVF
jgi:hypothetical protein